METEKSYTSQIVKDNEQAIAQALNDGNYVQAFLLVHALVESLLRIFLKETNDRATFSNLIGSYKKFLKREHYSLPIFIDELTKFNQRRNRIVHALWRKGFSLTNRQAEGAAHTAVIMYGLFIEWLETFDPEIMKAGFEYDEEA
jgi:hypothetical protein